jgi:integrase
MAKELLTDKQLRAARARAKEFLLVDGASLYARVRKTRDGGTSITWQFYFKWGGKTERLSIGPYPEVSLASARRRADEARQQLAADPPEHPVLAKREREASAHATALAKSRERTVRGLFDDWETVYLAHHRKDRGAHAREFMEHDVFPFVGELRATAITRADIADTVDRIVARGARRKANAVLATLKQMFAHGVVRGIVPTDPCYGFTRRHAGGEERSRERVLSLEELADLARALPQSGLGEPLQAAVRLLLATGARVGELNQARWEHVNLQASTWHIPKEHAKNGREHLVHLSAFAREQLATLAGFRVSAYLLPSRKTDAPIDDKALSKALRDRQRKKALKGRSTAHVGTLRLAGGDWSPHDLRRTFATRLADLGTLPHVIERALNHTMQGVMAVYNRNDYLPERRRALEAWGAELERIFAKARGNVVDLIPTLARRRAAKQ